MAITGGDVFEVTYNHPTLGDGTFFVKSGEDTTFDPGGFRTEDDMGAVAGNGQMIKKLNRMRWMFEGPIAWNMVTTNEIAQLSALAGDPEDAQWTVSHINGTVWSGLGTIVGEIPGSGQDATIPIKLSGGGIMEKISG